MADEVRRYVVRPGDAAENWVLRRRFPESVNGRDVELYVGGFREHHVAELVADYLSDLAEFGDPFHPDYPPPPVPVSESERP